VDEYTPRGKVKLRLRNILARLQGTQNTMPDQKLRGRPRKDLGTNTRTNTKKKLTKSPPAELIELSPAELIELSPAELIELSSAELTELSPVEPTELTLAELIELSPAEVIELSPTEITELSPTEPNTKLKKRRRGRLKKLTAVPPTALS
jgi:hypothetical protein